MKKFLAIFMARNKEFFKDTGTLIWVILFPIVMITGLSLALSDNNKPLYKIGIIGTYNESADFFQTKYLQYINYDSEDEAILKLSHHQIDFLINIHKNEYWMNSDSSKGYIVEKLFEITGYSQSFIKHIVTGKAIRYVDWVFPGVIAMNIMMNSLFGVGFVIVRYRKNGVLKRLKATPLNSFEFITGQIFSRLFIVVTINSFVFLICNLFLKFVIVGSLFNMLLITILGSFCHISLGLLFSCRFKSEELANGVINLVSWPMMMFSGIWFSLEGAPSILSKIANIFPLTHFVTALRKIMLEGASLTGVINHIIILVVMSVVFLISGSYLFKWDEN
ncbi:MAG: ABC transporter permease [Spirochaetes bacterium GWF1_31_7]|nr:MAG: ABC transporter permease [Spirochaetes bacterium GWE1_32_154]OHD45310.1 MAG: ABC transporter permease [Spirochaetes bacterium GWE2_31_10]OHD50950.1 MAG: ABC transporter permease [Spirochaetes bacterium GWF1_31_7]OHD78392.1 MAG: ABC transporter permease [Spirochaetes bacterium RIFOXYB1_FULL_32_8]HBD95587.1 ABC transporter permease [Spirochaetia bacterium]